MDIKPIQKVVTEIPDAEVTSTPEEQLKPSGLADAVDALEATPDASRPDYFSGKFLNESDFQQEQNYQRGQQPTDFTDGTFDPQKRYSSVHMQQGTVQLDADSNKKDVSLEDGIVVDFASGNARSPFVTGDLWDSATRPPEQQDPPASDDSNSTTTDPDPDKP